MHIAMNKFDLLVGHQLEHAHSGYTSSSQKDARCHGIGHYTYMFFYYVDCDE